jgi:histidinol-phosphatase
MSKTNPTLNELLEVAMDAAYQAGQRTLAYFKTGVSAEYKEDNTPVTVADKEAEAVLRKIILKHFPDHAILGEEEGETTGTAPYRWVLDPIDGTKAFVAGVPTYGTMIGVEVEGRPQVGVIYLAAQGDMVAAAEGHGCTWNGRPCRVSEQKDLSRAVIVTSSIIRAQQRSDAFGKLCDATYLQRTWGDAFGYCLVATGRVEAMIDPRISPWDIGPVPVLLKEAGGFAHTWAGENSIYGPDYFACNAHLHEQISAVLKTG